MMQNSRKTIACLVVFAGVLVSACSREPSAADLEKAVKADVAEANQRVQQMAASTGTEGKAGAEMLKDLKIEVHEVKKIKCTAVKDSADYSCDVEMDMTVPFSGKAKKTVPMRVTKTADGWKTVH